MNVCCVCDWLKFGALLRSSLRTVEGEEGYQGFHGKTGMVAVYITYAQGRQQVTSIFDCSALQEAAFSDLRELSCYASIGGGDEVIINPLPSTPRAGH
ncbi:hypothetical protein CDAR_316501 [Caerostris darwini]|uniref:Uncharacterized protein n=1 Tax=Caerostris darwini TaxID=1538125 RepID=A0AAV4UJ81_9ARAC|nr:hypothetical protein CDAR_316501 [Caerostris darwini]